MDDPRAVTFARYAPLALATGSLLLVTGSYLRQVDDLRRDVAAIQAEQKSEQHVKADSAARLARIEARLEYLVDLKSREVKP